MGHVGHVRGEYRAECRQCRIDGHVRKIEEIGGVAAVREMVSRLPWPALYRKALAMAAEIGVSTETLSEWVEAAAAEVETRRTR
jgi:hypothetical protein